MQTTLLGTLASLAVFIIPGYALTRLILPKDLLCLTDRVCIACGLSMAIIPIQLLVLTQLGILSGPASILGLVILALVVIVVQRVQERYVGGKFLWGRILGVGGHCSTTVSSAPVSTNCVTTKEAGIDRRTIPLEEILLVIVFLVTLIMRLLVIEGVNYPPGGDGYHHTLISQIIHDTGFIPQSYRPYAPLDRFTYHFGFHSLVAAWVWLTHLPVPRSTLLVSQIINALTVPTLYIFTKTLTGRKEAGLFAAMVAGLVTVMPAYYVNWSRNTQLTANVMMPVALVALIQVLEAPASIRWRWCVPAALLWAGLSLTHYTVWAHASVFLGVYVVIWLVAGKRGWRQLYWLAGCLIGGTALTLPWIWHMVKEFLYTKHIQMAGLSLLDSIDKEQAVIASTAPVAWAWFFSHVLRPVQAILTYLGTLVGMTTYPRVIITLIGWFGALFLLSTPAWSGLPHNLSLYNNFAVAIALYLAAAPTIALLLLYVTDCISDKWKAGRSLFLAGVVVMVCGWASTWQPRLLNPDQIFVTPADEKAIHWISAHLPKDARFTIRPFFLTPVIVIGIDGGYWLPYLAGRQVSIPPLTYHAEGDLEYLQQVFQYFQAWRKMQSLPDFINLLRTYETPYVYIGPRDPDRYRELLMSSGYFEVVYNEDNVTIFRLCESLW